MLVQFWDDTKTIPADVRECMKSWQPLREQGFDYLLFDDGSARQFIAKHFGHRHIAAFERCRHPAMRCDYFRLCYISEKGGFYVDADDVYQGGPYEFWFDDDRLKLQSLCYNVTSDSMVEKIDFIVDSSDSSDLIFYVNNNPLIAPPNHPVLRTALERSTKILLNHKGYTRSVQSTTGPGNLTASLVHNAIESERKSKARNFVFLADWHTVSVSQWPLEYRSDERNWRLWANH